MADMVYRVHQELNLVELKPVGEVHIEDILSYGHGLLDDGVIHQGTIEYVDMSDMTNLFIDYNGAQRLVEMHTKWFSAGWLGSVYFTPKDFQFGIIRMLGTVIESIPNRPTRVMIPLREKTPLEQLRGLISASSGAPL